MDEISGGSARDPEGSIDAGFNLWHEVGDWTFFDVILLIVFNPEVSSGESKNRGHRLLDPRARIETNLVCSNIFVFSSLMCC